MRPSQSFHQCPWLELPSMLPPAALPLMCFWLWLPERRTTDMTSSRAPLPAAPGISTERRRPAAVPPASSSTADLRRPGCALVALPAVPGGPDIARREAGAGTSALLGTEPLPLQPAAGALQMALPGWRWAGGTLV